MSRSLCVLHANCQGDEYDALLNASRAFREHFVLKRYTNYAREVPPDEELAGCAAFFYQHLADHWGTLASDRLTAKTPASALKLCLPNMMFRGYWPFWTDPPPIIHGDTLLNRLIDEGAPKPVILRIYLHNNLRSMVDLDASLANTIALERSKERQSFLPYVDMLEERWRDEAVFLTPNHPGEALLVRVAQGILRELRLPPLSAEELRDLKAKGGFPSYSNFEMPIHPQVAAHHKLAFIQQGHQFNVFGRPMTFEQYISRYIDCRLNGYDEHFMGYLQLV